MRESRIELRVCAYAKSKGMLVFKCTGHKGIPDRIFHYSGRSFYIEFKAPGKKPREIQKRVIQKILDQNIAVHLVDNVEDGVAVVNSILRGDGC